MQDKNKGKGFEDHGDNLRRKESFLEDTGTR